MPGPIPLSYSTSSTEYFERIRSLGGAWLLDSGKPDSERGRFDILVAQPAFRVRYAQGVTQILAGTANEAWSINEHNTRFTQTHPELAQLLHHYSETSLSATKPFNLLKSLYLLLAQRQSIHEEIPFYSGFVGYFGYDLGRTLETLPQHAANELHIPDMEVGYYQWAIIVDHEKQKASLVAHDQFPESSLKQLADLICSSDNKSKSIRFKITQAFASNTQEDQYHQRLKQINEYIHAGDCYQVNFAHRFRAEYEGDPWQGYKTLRAAAPTPFSAYHDTDRGAILSLSPERFVMCDETGKVTTQPIKGTRPRDNNPEIDNAYINDLITSEKDRAENVMIVDLLRNDISKTCIAGSVKAQKLFDVEHYKNVHHLVSTVIGQLQPQQTPIDLLEHCFPGGSITGAPKIRAMEIIDELESHRRHIYCGSIGYICNSGRMDTSITIRTLLAEDNAMYTWAGGGIVADSVSSAEYQETFDKINNLLKALETDA